LAEQSVVESSPLSSVAKTDLLVLMVQTASLVKMGRSVATVLLDKMVLLVKMVLLDKMA
jgi:hypothetical protein